MARRYTKPNKQMEVISDNNVMGFAPKIFLTPTDDTDSTRIDFEEQLKAIINFYPKIIKYYRKLDKIIFR